MAEEAESRFRHIFWSLRATGAFKPARIIGDGVRASLSGDPRAALKRIQARGANRSEQRRNEPDAASLRKGREVLLWQRAAAAEGEGTDSPPEFQSRTGWLKVDGRRQFLFVLSEDVDVDGKPSAWRGVVLASCRLSNVKAVHHSSEAVGDAVAAIEAAGATKLLVVEVGGEPPAMHYISQPERSSSSAPAQKVDDLVSAIEECVVAACASSPDNALAAAATIIVTNKRLLSLRKSTMKKLPSGLLPFWDVQMVDWARALKSEDASQPLELHLLFGNRGSVCRTITAPGALVPGAMKELERTLLGESAQSEGLRLPMCERTIVAISLAEAILLRGWLHDMAPDGQMRSGFVATLLEAAYSTSAGKSVGWKMPEQIREGIMEVAAEADAAIESQGASASVYSSGLAMRQRLQLEDECGALLMEMPEGFVQLEDEISPCTDPATGSRASTKGSTDLHAWTFDAGDGQPLVLRSMPAIDAPRTQARLQPGETFHVSEEMHNSGVIFLKVADGRGWAFDQKPGVGVMCRRIGEAPEKASDNGDATAGESHPVGPLVAEEQHSHRPEVPPLSLPTDSEGVAMFSQEGLAGTPAQKTLPGGLATPSKPAWADTSWASAAILRMEDSAPPAAPATATGTVQEADHSPKPEARTCSVPCSLQ